MNIVALTQIPAVNELLSQHLGDLDLRLVQTREELLADPATLQVWIATNMGYPWHHLDEATLAGATGLRFIQTLGVTADLVDLRAAADLGIPVAVNDGINTVAVAEQAIYLLMAVAKRARETEQARDQGLLGYPPTSELLGKTVCIVGFGRIGSAVAVRLHAFGMRVIAVDANPNVGMAQALALDELVTPDELHRALGQADFVMLTLPLSAATMGVIGERELRAMKPGAKLVNTSRGPLIDEQALRAAVREGRLAGFGADVWWREPIDPQDELLAYPTVIVTPHMGGLAAETTLRAVQYARQNVERFLRGERPLRVANGVITPR